MGKIKPTSQVSKSNEDIFSDNYEIDLEEDVKLSYKSMDDLFDSVIADDEDDYEDLFSENHRH